MNLWESEYRKKTPGSKRLFGRSKNLHVNGVSHNIRYFEPYPFVTKWALGKHLVDVDENRYTDYWMGHWALILGHCPPPVLTALEEQMKQGWMYGTLNEQTLALSEEIEAAVPAAERIRYVASGTEATMYAVRLARAVTGRSMIAKMEGGWHGYTSDLLKTVNWPFSEPESTGTIYDDKIISVPYNDTKTAIEILDRHGADLAGVLVEPFLGGGGGIAAESDFLCSMQEVMKRHGGLFMLDEIVSGFRMRYGCMYNSMNLDPDIVTLGKIVGGGMPMGAICGKREIMEAANTSQMSRTTRCYVGGGTFSANPASMTAGLSTLRVLKANPNIYASINQMGEDARSDTARILGDKVSVTGAGSMFMTHFLNDEVKSVTNAADAAQCDQNALRHYHMHLLGMSEIFFLPGKMGAISMAHTSKDIKDLASATEKFVAETHAR